jgi:predicted enzyme related to lactoylglutathione lyase
VRLVINAVHTLIYSDDAPATRAFLRDVIRWPFVEDANSQPGWLIFQTGPSELGVHPTTMGAEADSFTAPRHHSISLMCDDIVATVAELTARGAQFSGEVQDRGFGLVAMVQVPGAGEMMLYEPRHPIAHSG